MDPYHALWLALGGLRRDGELLPRLHVLGHYLGSRGLARLELLLLLQLVDDARQLFEGHPVEVRVDRCLDRHQLLVACLSEVVIRPERLEEGHEGAPHPWRGSLVPASLLVGERNLRVSIRRLGMVETQADLVD